MMKRILFIILLLGFSSVYSQVDEKLSPEEKARRQKNIDIGNPFAKFGYKPKIATLSKGKYLEFHDRDTIVKIGSFSYNTRQHVITGYHSLDSLRSEATLHPTLISRWFSPDPLSEEFPSWSPYNYVKDNPIMFIDPDGRYVDVSDYYKKRKGESNEDFAKRQDVLSKTISDLSKLSGVNIYVKKVGNTHMLWYDKNSKPSGKYSETLLDDLSNAIFDMSKVVSVYDSKNGSNGIGQRIELDGNEIEENKSNPTNVDGNTMGYGLTFMHELEHTDSGYNNSSGTKEMDVIDRINTMRKELNQKGLNYGQRQEHNAPTLGKYGSKTRIIPFNEKTADELYHNGYMLLPTGKGAKFLIIKSKRK